MLSFKYEDGGTDESTLFRSGDIVFIRVFGRPTLIVNSVQAAFDLMEKRSTKYSDRAPSVLFSELYVLHIQHPVQRLC